MSGVGVSTASAEATGATGFSVLADSFFDVFFDVTAASDYTLLAAVEWAGETPPFFGYARVQLIDVTNATVPAEIYRDPMLPGTSTLSTTVALSTGVTYRLRAESHIAGGFDVAGEYGSTANWVFDLSQVPEPASATLVVVALLGLSACGARRRPY
jgi:hypothetical protein